MTYICTLLLITYMYITSVPSFEWNSDTSIDHTVVFLY